VIFKVTQGHWH